MGSNIFNIYEVFEDKESFKSGFETLLLMRYGKSVESSTIYEKYNILGELLMSYMTPNWKDTREVIQKNNKKSLYYFSLEFLMGRMLTNNMLSLGLYDLIKDSLSELNIDINDIEECEADAGLGNGGLGRLAACFLDSLASLNYPAYGNTIRYRNGLFKQLIVEFLLR